MWKAVIWLSVQLFQVLVIWIVLIFQTLIKGQWKTKLVTWILKTPLKKHIYRLKYFRRRLSALKTKSEVFLVNPSALNLIKPSRLWIFRLHFNMLTSHQFLKIDHGIKRRPWANYRLVSILPSFSKIFEKPLYKQLSTYFQITLRFQCSFLRDDGTQYHW